MSLHITPIQHIPEIRQGMDLAGQIQDGMKASGLQLQDLDIIAVTQKVVSKAEGRVIRLHEIEPSVASIALARQTKKDPRLMEVILRESRRIVRVRGDILICETTHGFICANAGVDHSNIETADTVSLLPKDPDRSARFLADALGCGVIITDTFGRPWREGLVDMTIGLARIPPFIDFRGKPDNHGRELKVTMLAAVDALAAAAGLAMGKTDRAPAALIRGFIWEESRVDASQLLRTYNKDLFL